jgi:hypothetical protein
MLIKHIKRLHTIITPQKKVQMTKNVRIGTLVAYRNNDTDEINIGWSVVNHSAGDKFDKKTGVETALARAVPINKLHEEVNNIPFKVQNELPDFVERCNSYFKPQIVVEVRGGVAYCDDPRVKIVDHD